MRLSAAIQLVPEALPVLPKLVASLEENGCDEIAYLWSGVQSFESDFFAGCFAPPVEGETQWIVALFPGERLVRTPGTATLKQELERLAVNAIALNVVDSDDVEGKHVVGHNTVIRAVRRGAKVSWGDNGFALSEPQAIGVIPSVLIHRQRLSAFFLEQGAIDAALRTGQFDRTAIGKRHYLRARAQADLEMADAAIGRKKHQEGWGSKTPSTSLGLWLNLGSSRQPLEGFENLDLTPFPEVISCDIRLGLPYKDGSAEVIVASHILEHLHPWKELPLALADIRRVLAPGGTFRLSVPDLMELVCCYSTGDFIEHAATQEEVKRVAPVEFSQLPRALQFSSICFGNNSGNASYDGHQAVWDSEALIWMLERTGFKEARRVTPGVSRHPSLMQRYQDAHVEQSVIVEATR